ncbi:hypothetical protein D3C85_1023700 [compost metagenome]
MADGQDRLDSRQIDAQAVGEFLKLAAQVAALVGGVDQGQGDGVFGGAESRGRGLGLKMLPQGGVARVGALHGLAVHAAAGTGARPVGQAGLLADFARVALAVGVAFAGGVVIEILGARIHGVLGVARRLGELEFAGLARGGGFSGFGGAVAALVALVALQQGVLFQLGLDVGFQLKIRQLQQLDRLLQLGRDDQPLTLSDLKPLTDHVVSIPPASLWPGSCCDRGAESLTSGERRSRWPVARGLRGRGIAPRQEKTVQLVQSAARGRRPGMRGRPG